MFPIFLFYEVCYSFNIYLLINDLKLENQSQNAPGLMQVKPLLVDLFHFLGNLNDQESNR